MSYNFKNKKKFKPQGAPKRANSLIVYTDGSSRGNPGPGGWSVIVQYMDKQVHFFKGYRYTTNNRMELLAIISALEELGPGRQVDIYTDSQYCIDGCTKWIHGWMRRDWKTREETDIKNKDLWMQVQPLLKENSVTFHKVKGHSGDVLNDVADHVAVQAALNHTDIDDVFEKEANYTHTEKV